MKSTLLLGLLASISFASARVLPGTHVLAVSVSLISGPLPALAKPVWRYTSTRLSPRQVNSTTSAAGTYTVASGDTLNAIAAAEGVSTQQLEDANPGVVPTDLQVGQVLNLPSSASSNGTLVAMNGTSSSAASITTSTAIVSPIPASSTPATASSVTAITTSSGTDMTSTSENAPTATATNTGDTSDLGSVINSGKSGTDAGDSQQNSTAATCDTDNGDTQTNTTSSCGGHHHRHHNSTGTTGSTTQGQNNG